MKIVTILLVQIVFICSDAYSQSITCNEIVEYRDVHLFEQYQKEMTGYELEFDRFSEHLELLENVKTELEELNQGSDIGGLFASLNLATTVIEGIISNTLSKAIQNSVSGAEVTTLRVYNSINDGRDSIELLAQQNFEDVLLKQFINYIPYLNSVSDIIDGIKSLDDYSKAKAEIQTQLILVSREMKKVSDSINSLEDSKIVALNNFKNHLDEYLTTNCN